MLGLESCCRRRRHTQSADAHRAALVSWYPLDGRRPRRRTELAERPDTRPVGALRAGLSRMSWGPLGGVGRDTWKGGETGNTQTKTPPCASRAAAVCRRPRAALRAAEERLASHLGTLFLPLRASLAHEQGTWQ